MDNIQMDCLQEFVDSKGFGNQNFKCIGFQKILAKCPLRHAVCLLLIGNPELQEASYLIAVTIKSVVYLLESLFNHAFASYLFEFLCLCSQCQESLKVSVILIDRLKRLYLQDLYILNLLFFFYWNSISFSLINFLSQIHFILLLLQQLYFELFPFYSFAISYQIKLNLRYCYQL